MVSKTTQTEVMPATNMGYVKVAVQYSTDTFVFNHILVLSINICVENHHLLQTPKVICNFKTDQIIQ